MENFHAEKLGNAPSIAGLPDPRQFKSRIPISCRRKKVLRFQAAKHSSLGAADRDKCA
jgi:hypothetical protein